MEAASDDVNKRSLLIEMLIKEVERTPVLWDKNHKDHKSRVSMDLEWEKIGLQTNTNKDWVKQRWRNLRDQFTREIKKVKVPYGNPKKPYLDYYRGKWIYFQQMMFLRDTSSIRTRICYSPAEDIDIHEEDIIKKEPIIFEDDLYAEQANMNSNESDIYENEPSVTVPRVADNQNGFSHIPILPLKIEILDEDGPIVKGVKRHVSGNKSEPPVKAKISKPLLVDASTNTDPEKETHEDVGDIDEDLHFVKSLVPSLRRLTPVRKLLVRNEIQSLLIRESLCENCKFGKSSSLQS